MTEMGIIWLVAAVVFAIIESVTYQLVSIWFAGGCIASLIAVLINPDISLTVQLAICLVVSGVLVAATRPFVKKVQNGKIEPTNVDALIGKTAVITERVDNVAATGEAQLDGKLWTARSSDNTAIESGSRVTVEKLDGVKLIVKKER